MPCCIQGIVFLPGFFGIGFHIVVAITVDFMGNDAGGCHDLFR
jgi:hypothetical protein